MQYIDAEDILKATNGGLDIILDIYPDAGQSVHQPNRKFKTREEKTASAKLNRLDSGIYLVVDFGQDQKSRNGIHCFQTENNCTYVEALQILGSKYSVSNKIEEDQAKFRAVFSEKPATADDEEKKWSFMIRESFSDQEIETIFSVNTLKHVGWKHKNEDRAKSAYSRIAALFKEYRWHPLISYSIVKDRRVMTFSSTPDFPLFLIDEGTHRKLYQPRHQDKGKRFMYEPGQKPKNFIHGYEQMTKAYEANKRQADGETNDKKEVDPDAETETSDPKFEGVYYCTGGSDALNVALITSGDAKNKTRVLWPNGETEKLIPSTYKNIQKYTKKFYNVPDIDATGKREAHKMAMEYLDVFTIVFPEELKKHYDARRNPCKDLRDYLNHYNEYDFNLLQKSAMPYRFWEVVAKYNRDGEFKSNTYELKNSRVYNFLQCNGFFRYMVGDKKTDWEFIKITDNVARFIDGHQVRDFIKVFLRDRMMDENLRDAVFNTTRLNDTSLANIDLTELNFIDYDKHKQIYFFNNCAVEITADQILKRKPGEVDCSVWEDDVIDHRLELIKDAPFEITKDDQGGYDIKILNNKCIFLNYLINTSRAHWRKELETGDKYKSLAPADQLKYKADHQFSIDGTNLNDEEIAEQKQHLINKIFVIGYLLHRYKDSSRTWMIYAMDGHTREDFLSHGGSGKSILFNVAMKKMLRNNFNINGRDIAIDKNSHKYDGITEFTRYLTIEDAHQYLNLDVFFNDITGDLEVNPKGKTPYTVRFAQSPKFALTTNFTGRNMGGSTLRRLLNAVFADYYHTATSDNDYLETRTPNTEFGLNLISDFDWSQNNLFYNTQLLCLKFFLGVSEKLEPNMSNVTRRQLLATMGAGFYDWAKAYFDTEGDRLDTLITREEVFFDMKYVTQNKNHTPQLFLDKLKAYCKLNGFILNPTDMLGKQGNIIKKVEKKRYDATNNVWYTLGDNTTTTKEMLFIQTSADIPDAVKPAGQQQKDNPAPNLLDFKIENDLKIDDDEFPF